MSDTDTHTPPLRQPEYMLGLALSVFLTLTAIFFIAGLADAPVDFVDLEPGASFDSVRASVDGPLLGALVVSAVAVTPVHGSPARPLALERGTDAGALRRREDGVGHGRLPAGL